MATKKNTNKEEQIAVKEEQITVEPEKDLEAENAELKAQLEAETAELKAQLEALMKAQAEKQEPEQTGPKMVKIKIPKTKEEKEDVFVSVNFRTYQIQRGVEVEVPDFVYEVLQNREKMLEEIMIFEEQAQHRE